MRNNIPRGVVRCAGNVPANVVDVADQVSQPPGCVEHPDGCSATRVAPRSTRTRTRLDDDLRSPIQQRWRKQTSGRSFGSTTASDSSRDASIPLQAHTRDPTVEETRKGRRPEKTDLNSELYLFSHEFLCINYVHPACLYIGWGRESTHLP